jgi:hypothetical protein
VFHGLGIEEPVLWQADFLPRTRCQATGLRGLPSGQQVGKTLGVLSVIGLNQAGNAAIVCEVPGFFPRQVKPSDLPGPDQQASSAIR